MVGINTAVAGVGLGMAVPVNATTRRIISALMHDGRVRRAYLGVVTIPGPVPAAWRERLGRTTGLLVHEVVANGPAARACAPETSCSPPPASRSGPPRTCSASCSPKPSGIPFSITVMRNGALVDVIAEPKELVAA